VTHITGILWTLVRARLNWVQGGEIRLSCNEIDTKQQATSFFQFKKKKAIQLTSDVDGFGNKSGSQIGEYKTDIKLRHCRPGGHKRESEILLLHRLITGYKQWQCTGRTQKHSLISSSYKIKTY
jgi:hypothetical protein